MIADSLECNPIRQVISNEFFNFRDKSYDRCSYSFIPFPLLYPPSLGCTLNCLELVSAVPFFEGRRRRIVPQFKMPTN